LEFKVLANGVRGGEMIHRNIEKTLNGGRVRVDRHRPADAGRGKHVGDRLCGDRLPRRRLPSLAGTAGTGHHHADRPRESPPRRVDIRITGFREASVPSAVSPAGPKAGDGPTPRGRAGGPVRPAPRQETGPFRASAPAGDTKGRPFRS